MYVSVVVDVYAHWMILFLYGRQWSTILL